MTARRRRESDRAEERARQAARLGDRAAFLMATALAEAARRRRDEWAEGEGGKG
ncbi:MAG: hypothetical protein ACXW4L_06865 [Candidatus Limnocylindrales bacterium]